MVWKIAVAAAAAVAQAATQMSAANAAAEAQKAQSDAEAQTARNAAELRAQAAEADAAAEVQALQAEQVAADANAELARTEASRSRTSFALEEDRLRESQAAFIGSLRAAQGSNEAAIGSGTFLDVVRRQAENHERDALILRREGAIEAQRHEEEAALQELQSRSAGQAADTARARGERESDLIRRTGAATGANIANAGRVTAKATKVAGRAQAIGSVANFAGKAALSGDG